MFKGNKPARQLVFDYLRALVIVLVVLHHSIIAYASFVQINFENPIANFSPVVGNQRWHGFDLILGFNDLYFMHLMFFVSGLFIWGSITRKGIGLFLKDRFVRLGIPFVLGLALLMPLAYFPTLLQVGSIKGLSFNYFEFWGSLAKHGFPASGPLWFIWLLFAYNLLAVLLYRLLPGFGEIVRRKKSAILTRPVFFFGSVFGYSVLAHLSMLLFFEPYEWIGIGPFNVQASRVVLYLFYFLAGAWVGAYGTERTFFTRDSKLVQYWWAWIILSLATYTALCLYPPVSSPGMLRLFAVNCFTVSTMLAFIANFLKFTEKRIGILDSLSKNSYGIYIVHYVYVTWLQYALMNVHLNAIPKAVIVFTGTLFLSWSTVAVIRRIPIIHRIV